VVSIDILFDNMVIMKTKHLGQKWGQEESRKIPFVFTIRKCSSFFLFYFFWQYWGLKSRLCAWLAGALPLEPGLQPQFLVILLLSFLRLNVYSTFSDHGLQIFLIDLYQTFTDFSLVILWKIQYNQYILLPAEFCVLCPHEVLWILVFYKSFPVQGDTQAAGHHLAREL
jgi:hypothetical protein